MFRKMILAALCGSALALTGCARETGGGGLVERFGQSNELNLARQVAYRDPSAFLSDLARVFRAETDETVTFAFNRARLDSTARRALDGQIAWLKRNPEVRMTVTGHADAVGGERYNQRLGLRRAQAAVAYLVRGGIERDRLDAVESRGETDLAVQTQNRERRNRRTVTAVAGFARNYVGTGLDGRVAERLYTSYISETQQASEASSSDTGG
ncbi:MAG: OmpA family protein [Pseudomonadota bacterium]